METIGRDITNDTIIKESRGPFHGIAVFMMLPWKS